MTPTQEQLFKLLLEIDDICKRNGIEYFLDQGTILGVVRHGGFLPWDNDLDICMTEPNYDKFVAACERELDHTTRSFCDNRRNREFPTVFGHYIDMTCCRMTNRTPFWDYQCGQTIDIFCLVELPGDLEENKRLSNLYFAYDEYVNQSFRHYFRKTKDIYDIYHELYRRERTEGRENVLKWCEEQIFGHHYEDCNMLLCTSARMHWNSFLPKSMYDCAQKVEWNGHSFRIPGDWYEMMTINYGDSFYEVPKNPIIHSEQSHTEFPVMAYVDDFMAVTDKKKLLKDRLTAKQIAFEDGYRENVLNAKFFKGVGIVECEALDARLEESGADLMELVEQNTLDSALEAERLLGSYMTEQCNSSVQYWRAHFGHSDAADCAILFVYLVVYGNIQPMIRLMQVRLQNGLAVTPAMQRLIDAGKTYRKMKKSYYYKDIPAGREAELWVWANLPRSEHVRCWHLLYEFLAAKGIEDESQREAKLGVCLEMATELLLKYPDSCFAAKVKADILHELGREQEALELYLAVQELSCNGFDLKDIAAVFEKADEEVLATARMAFAARKEANDGKASLIDPERAVSNAVQKKAPARSLLPVQKKLLQLIEELDAACQELGIQYALHGETAAWAKARKKFVGGQCSFEIMMRAGDAVRLKAFIEAKGDSTRAIEDLSNNPLLPFNQMRYVACDSTLLDKEEPVRYALNGVAVLIIPLFSKPASKMYRQLAITHAFKNCGWSYGEKPLQPMRRRLIAATKALDGVAGKERLPLWFYKQLFKDVGKGSAFLYEINAPTTELKLMESVLTDAKRIKFEHLKLPLPGQAKAYIKKWYGVDWAELDKEELKPVTANRVRCIHDGKRPFEESLAMLKTKGFDYRVFQQESFEFEHWYNENFRYWDRIQGNGYAGGRRSRDRIDIFTALKPQMGTLRKAAKKGDTSTLKAALEAQDYFDLTDRYFARGMGFFITQEIFDFAAAVWKDEGKEGYASDVLALVPDYYRTLNLEAYLDSYLQ